MSFGYSLKKPSGSNLRYKVDVLALGAADDYGEPAYTPILTGIFCDVQDLRGFELIRAQKLSAKVTHYATCRFNPLITANMRLLFDGTRLFYVWAILDEFSPRKTWMALYCEELQAENLNA
jgi:SPP1 family predicted phage head-tail adaptor